MKFTNLLLVLSAIGLVGCATHQSKTNLNDPSRIIASEESAEHPDYQKHYSECHRYTSGDHVDVGSSAIGGAAVGAGIAAAMGAIVGVNSGYGSLAGVGALSGALSGAAGAATHNKLSDMEYKRTMVQCLRDKGYHVY